MTIAAAPAAAIVTSGDPAASIAHPGRPAYGVAHEGVGQLRLYDNTFGEEELLGAASVTLISDRHVLTAAHVVDLDQDNRPSDWFDPPTVTRREVRFELPDGVVEIPITENIEVPPDWFDQWADIAVIELAEPAPPSVPRYPLYGGDSEVGRPLTVIGAGLSGIGESGYDFGSIDFDGPKRAARNRYEATGDQLDASLPGLIVDPDGSDPPPGATLLYDFDSRSEANNAFSVWGFDSDTGFGDSEGLPAPGDSGSPEFINGAVAGVVAFGLPGATGADATDEWDGSWGEVAGSTRVSTFRDFIDRATGGAARFVTDGDYDKNGLVNAADYDLWRQQYGRTDFAPADGDGDGAVTAADYTLWRDRTGGSTTGGAVHPIPEPRSATLVAVGCLSVLGGRRAA